MSNDLYPNAVRGITWTVARTPEFNTIVQVSPSFMETSIIQAQNPRRHWELKYDYLKDRATDIPAGLTYTDFQTLEAFFLTHYGQGDSFLFDDVKTPDDNVGPALVAAAPNLAASLRLIQDPISGTWYSPIQIYRGGTWWEDIDYVDFTRGMSVYANGVSKTVTNTSSGGYDCNLKGPGLAISGNSFAGMYLQWTGTPAPIGPITASFYYYWRVKFDSDQQAFEKFMNSLWTAGDRGGASIKLRSTRSYVAGS